MDAGGAPGRDDPAPFDRFLAGAAGRPGLWRVALGLALTVGAWFATSALALAALVALARAGGAPISSPEALLAAGGPAATALVLASFAGVWVGLWAALRVLHRRGMASLLGRLSGFGGGAGLGLVLYGATLLGGMAVAGAPMRTDLGIGTWALWLPVLGLLVLVQAGAEEALFRGYVLQEIARRLRHPLAWAVAPALAFGALHYSPGLPGGAGALYAGVTFLFALVAALLVHRTGGLGAALGMHAALNACGLSLAGIEGVVSGSQLWLFPQTAAPAVLAADLAASLAILAYLLSGRGPR